jgi:hypothetical protein
MTDTFKFISPRENANFAQIVSIFFQKWDKSQRSLFFPVVTFEPTELQKGDKCNFKSAHQSEFNGMVFST